MATQQATAADRKWVSVAELADEYGVCEHTIRRWTQPGHDEQLPFYRFGRSIRFKRSEVDQWERDRKARAR